MSRLGATKTVTQPTNPQTAATRSNFHHGFISESGIARRKKDKRPGSVTYLRLASLIAFVLWSSPITKLAIKLFPQNAPEEYLLVAQKDAEKRLGLIGIL